jgi:hypothetical protein
MNHFWKPPLVAFGTIVLALALVPAAFAGHGRHYGCGESGHCGPYPLQWVAKTVMVPEVYYETQSVPVTVCHPEVREETVTVMRRVPEVRPVRVTFTIMETKSEMRTISYPVNIPSWRTVTREVTVMVPYTEMRQGVRSVPREVQETVMQTVCRQIGHYECRSYTDCCGRVHTCNIWVPQTITEQVPVKVCRVEWDQVPYEYPVTLCKPEVRTVQDRVCDVRVEMRTAQVPFTYCVPRPVERVVNETYYRCVPEQQVVRHTIMVPHTEMRQVPVCRTRMVPKQVYCLAFGSACAGCP